MDGGLDEDGTERDFVAFASPLEQPHTQRERSRVAAESRLPLTGSAAYRGVHLTGAFQATLPAYRHTSSFGQLGDVTQLTDGTSAAPASAAAFFTVYPMAGSWKSSRLRGLQLHRDN